MRFRKQFEGNGRIAIVQQQFDGLWRVYVAMSEMAKSEQFEDYKTKAKAMRVAKDWIEYGA